MSEAATKKQTDELVADAEVVDPSEPGVPGNDDDRHQELVPAGPAPATLFHTDDPRTVLERATDAANALKGVLDKQGLTSKIQGKDHVNVEGWQTLGAMLGVTPVLDYSRPVYEGTEKVGWEARVKAQTLDGRVIGTAESECLSSEQVGRQTWGDREDFARRSMAQTRATSKALASVLRFVVTLAGYSGTPADEMPPVEQGPEFGPAVSKEGQKAASEALSQILGKDAKGAWESMVSDAGGYMPKITAQAIVTLRDTLAPKVEKATKAEEVANDGS
jgi:hypothetical protein